MKINLKKIIDFVTIKYGLVGLLNFTSDFVVLNFFYKFFGINLILSTASGFITGSIVGFVLHSKWTFKYNTGGKNFLKFSQFIFVSCTGLIITVSIVHLLSNIVGVYYNISKLIAVFFSILWAYSASRWWIFKKIKTQDEKS